MYVSSSKVEQETPFFIFFLPYEDSMYCMPIQMASSCLNLCFQRKLVLATSLDTAITFERLSSWQLCGSYLYCCIQSVHALFVMLAIWNPWLCTNGMDMHKLTPMGVFSYMYFYWGSIYFFTVVAQRQNDDICIITANNPLVSGSGSYCM